MLKGPGRAVASSSLRIHALREGKMLWLGFDPPDDTPGTAAQKLVRTAKADWRVERRHELLERIRAHDQIEVSGSEIRGPGGIEVTARRVGAAP